MKRLNQQEIIAGSGGLRETLSGISATADAEPCVDSCDTPMWLVLIEPDETNSDRRTFECPRCQEETVVVVDIRPEAG